MTLDIMRVREAVKNGEMKFEVKGKKIYCANNYGECVIVGVARVLNEIRDKLSDYDDTDGIKVKYVRQMIDEVEGNET